MKSLKIINVTPQNVSKETLFCIKDIKKPGFESKRIWFEKRFKEGLKLKILTDNQGKMIGFIEYVPATYAWRPIDANDYMFIHCMYITYKKDRNRGNGTLLINEAIKDAKALNLSGLCVMTSDGSWMANKTVFEKEGFLEVDKRGRFELLSKSFKNQTITPKLLDWTLQLKKYSGWHVIYAAQCPWHEKSIFDLSNAALDFGIELNITKLKSAKEAKNAPSGFGVFSLINNGQLLEDHYISATRFKNILQKETQKN